VVGDAVRGRVAFDLQPLVILAVVQTFWDVCHEASGEKAVSVQRSAVSFVCSQKALDSLRAASLVLTKS
jgi:hypothetical protein